MVWGPPGQHGPPGGSYPGQSGHPGYAAGYPGSSPGQSPQSPQSPGHGQAPAGDPFAAAENETQALVTAPWWPSSQPAQRQQVLNPHLLRLPDNTWWMFGKGGRWYRLHPSDRRWYLCPPPAATMTRRSARPAQPGQTPPQVPPPLFPLGPDLATGWVPPAAVVGRPVPENIIFQLRQILTEAGSAPASDYPLNWNFFASGTPSTIAVAWAATLWCASVPVFDTDTPLLELWRPYLKAPFEDHGRTRWLLPPSLGGVCALHAERLRAGRPDAVGQLARFMVMTARALREDARFRFRGDALLTMVEPMLSQPGIDQQAVGYGDTAVEQRWMSRCPASLSPALRWDTSPGECFQHAWYDLATALRPLCGDPDSPSFVEPRNAATALLAADMAGYRPDLAAKVGRWLDPEARDSLGAVLGDPGHALRRLWPARGLLPDTLAPATRETVLAVLGASTAMNLSWCRVVGGIPIPPDGFTVPDACVAGLETAPGSRSGSAVGGAAPAAPPNPAPPVTSTPAPTPPPLVTPPPFAVAANSPPPPGVTPPPFSPPAAAPPPHAVTPPPFPPSAEMPPSSSPRPPAAAGSPHGDSGQPPAPSAWDGTEAPTGASAGSGDPLEDEAEGSWTRMWGT